jgi:DNA polymerase-3 subunit beta
MKLQISQENLSKAVSLASRFTSSRAQLPILGNILLTVNKNKLNVSSTNLEVSVSSQIAAKVDSEGEISIPSKVLLEIVSNLPKETLTLESDKEQLKINTSSFSSKVLGMNTSDFPKVPASISREKSLVLSSDKFFEALGKVLFSTSVDETRPILTGVLFILTKDSLTLVSTDGFRLSRKVVNVSSGKIDSLKVILPKFVLSEINRSSDSDEVAFEIQDKEKQALFGLGDVVLSSIILEGEYPDFEKIIPKNSICSVTLDKEDFLRAIKLSAPFARDNSNIVKIKILKGAVNVLAESSQAGNQEMKVDAKIEGESKDFEISFNFKFLEDFLDSVKGEEIKMEFVSTDKAGIFLDTSDKDYLHLIMPVRVQS